MLLVNQTTELSIRINMAFAIVRSTRYLNERVRQCIEVDLFLKVIVICSFGNSVDNVKMKSDTRKWHLRNKFVRVHKSTRYVCTGLYLSNQQLLLMPWIP